MTQQSDGKGAESVRSIDIVLDFIELIQAARDNLAAMQSLTQKYNFQLVKMASNLTDWMEMNDIDASRQISFKSQGLPQMGQRQSRPGPNIGVGDSARLEQKALASRSQKAPGGAQTTKVKKEKE